MRKTFFITFFVFYNMITKVVKYGSMILSINYKSMQIKAETFSGIFL